MERVSFKVAKALKEVGYPQGTSEYLYDTDETFASKYDYKQWNINTLTKIDMPTYLEVWLWLCDKGIVFFPAMYSAHEPSGYSCFYRDNIRVLDYDSFGIHSNPEEAIIAAIEYLVDNDLIK